MKTTNALLFAIALGLWLTLVQDWTRPTPAHAQAGTPMEGISRMSLTTYSLWQIANGTCENLFLCPPRPPSVPLLRPKQ